MLLSKYGLGVPTACFPVSQDSWLQIALWLSDLLLYSPLGGDEKLQKQVNNFKNGILKMGIGIKSQRTMQSMETS